MHITLKTDWESPLPDRYLAPLPQFPVVIPGSVTSGSGSQMSNLTGTTSSTNTSGSLTPGSHSPVPPSNSGAAFAAGVVSKCVPYLDEYAPYRASGKRVRIVIKDAHQAGHTLPTNDKNGNMCISYHVKGVCNSNCGRSSDHAPHNAGETARLLAWCESAFAT
jgi:hypothetical protein